MLPYRTLYTILVTGLLLASFITGQEAGEGKHLTDTYFYSVSDYAALDVNFTYGLGTLTVKPNLKKQSIIGTISYNSNKVNPKIDFSGSPSRGQLNVSVETYDVDNDVDIKVNNFNIGRHIEQYENEMDFMLPGNIPTRLMLDFGIGEADLDLSGIQLNDLSLDCGLSEAKITITEPNDIDCDWVSINNGLGDLTVRGLGNIRARNIKLGVGLGSAYIDMRGGHLSDTDVRADVGLGSLELILPRQMNIRIEVDHSFMSSVTIKGMIRKGENEYISSEWKNGQPTMTMDLGVGLGSVDVDVRD